MAYGKVKMGKKLNPTTEPGDDRRRVIEPPVGGVDIRRRTTPANIKKPATPAFRPKLTKGAR